MGSTIVIVTAITAFLGLLLNSGVLYLVLSRGKKKYHHLFGGVLFICAIWDLGIFLSMLRNSYENELVIYGYIVLIPVVFLPALIYHFTREYLGLPKVKLTPILWVICIFSSLGIITGLAGKISGVIQYSWGNIYRIDPTLRVGTLASFPLYAFSLLSSCWLLWRANVTEDSPITRRHNKYIFTSFLALLIALVKVGVLFDLDLSFLLPTGMLLNDIFAALIGIAIIKEHLFDVTVVIKKGAIYSLLATLTIFVFSFSEHLLATYVGELLGGHSTTKHLISIAIVIAVLMPFKHRLEHAIEAYFARKKLVF
jgi:hypothetical protein